MNLYLYLSRSPLLTLTPMLRHMHKGLYGKENVKADLHYSSGPLGTKVPNGDIN